MGLNPNTVLVWGSPRAEAGQGLRTVVYRELVPGSTPRVVGTGAREGEGPRRAHHQLNCLCGQLSPAGALGRLRGGRPGSPRPRAEEAGGCLSNSASRNPAEGCAVVTLGTTASPCAGLDTHRLGQSPLDSGSQVFKMRA